MEEERGVSEMEAGDAQAAPTEAQGLMAAEPLQLASPAGEASRATGSPAAASSLVLPLPALAAASVKSSLRTEAEGAGPWSQEPQEP